MSMMCRPGPADLEHGAALALARARAADASPRDGPEEAALVELRALWPHVDAAVLRAAIRRRLAAERTEAPPVDR